MNKNHALKTLWLAALLGLWAGALPAATLTVTSLNDSGPGSLRQAIADAVPGDTVDFAVTGTITLTNGQLVIEKELSITGPGPLNLVLSGNNASRVIYVSDATALFTGITIADGNAVSDHGGGLYHSGNRTLAISNCIIRNCTSYFAGGGVFSVAGAALSFVHSTITGNSAQHHLGGGVYSSTYLVMHDSTVSSNSAEGGGGMAMFSGGSLVNCTVSGNSTIYAQRIAGGLYTRGPLSLTNCTVAFNKASERGGGIVADDLVVAWNSVIAANGAYFYGPIQGSDCSGPLLSLGYNLIQNTNGCAITGVTTHNIYGKDPMLGPLADNGGPTLTHALLPGSPAIDHGSSGGLATDQRGLPRTFNFPAYFDADDGSDIGAVEMQEGPQTGPVFIVNTTDDTDDGMAGLAHCSLREAINAANANADTNTIRFAVEVPGLHTGVTGTIILTNTQNGGELLILKTNTLAILGPGAAGLSISGNGAHRVFWVSRASDFTLTMVSVTNGYAGFGGGLANFGGIVLLVDVRFMGNNAYQGGAIDNGGSLHIINAVFEDNHASIGGAITIPGSAVSTLVERSALVRNTASVYGGAIACQHGLEIVSTTVSSNSCGGGAGGGINLNAGGSALISNSTICGNNAPMGGGIASSVGSVQMRNTIVAGNSATNAPDVSTYPGSPLISGDFNMIQDTNGCFIIGSTAHNIYGLDPKLGPLADLGGPTPTHALRFDSPALDAGHSGGLTTDQRGLPRSIDDPNTPNATGGDGSDIGAYEADSILRINRITKSGADILLSFNTVFGRTYRVERKDDLNLPWSPLFDSIIGDGSSVQLQNSGVANLPQRFYRVVLLP